MVSREDPVHTSFVGWSLRKRFDQKSSASEKFKGIPINPLWEILYVVVIICSVNPLIWAPEWFRNLWTCRSDVRELVDARLHPSCSCKQERSCFKFLWMHRAIFLQKFSIMSFVSSNTRVDIIFLKGFSEYWNENLNIVGYSWKIIAK